MEKIGGGLKLGTTRYSSFPTTFHLLWPTYNLPLTLIAVYPPLSPTPALWSGTNKNKDISTGPLPRPFARLLAPLTRSLDPDCSLLSRPPLRSLVYSLARFAHPHARGKVNLWCLKMTWFCPIVPWDIHRRNLEAYHPSPPSTSATTSLLYTPSILVYGKDVH